MWQLKAAGAEMTHLAAMTHADESHEDLFVPICNKIEEAFDDRITNLSIPN